MAAACFTRFDSTLSEDPTAIKRLKPDIMELVPRSLADAIHIVRSVKLLTAYESSALLYCNASWPGSFPTFRVKHAHKDFRGRLS